MINGIDYLRKMYPSVSESQLQPGGLDLKVGKIYSLTDNSEPCGLFKDKKVLPIQKEILPLKKSNREGWVIEPKEPYIIEIDSPIHIKNANTQLYFPRSSLIRSGVHIYSCVGDAGYSGKLSFLMINHSPRSFFLEKGARFAQLLDFQTAGADLYDGDYQEDKQEPQWLLDDCLLIGVEDDGYPITLFGKAYEHEGYLNVRDGEKLHRVIYEFFFGKIPKGKVIHHINHNKLDDRIGNLVLMDDFQHRSLHNKGVSNPAKKNRKYDLPYGFTFSNNLFNFQYHDDDGKRHSFKNKRLDFAIDKAISILKSLNYDYSKEISDIIEWKKKHDIDIITFSKMEKNNLPYRCTVHKKGDRKVYEFYENSRYIGGGKNFNEAVKKAIENTEDPLYKSYLEKRWLNNFIGGKYV